MLLASGLVVFFINGWFSNSYKNPTIYINFLVMLFCCYWLLGFSKSAIFDGFSFFSFCFAMGAMVSGDFHKFSIAFSIFVTHWFSTLYNYLQRSQSTG